MTTLRHTDNTDRTASLQRLVPELFSGKWKTVLYIGARNDRIDYGPEFRDSGYKITILEAFEPNCRYLLTLPWVSAVIHADIRSYNKTDTWDVVFWWHGPEHVKSSELPTTLEKIESLANHLVVLGCPWGTYKQGAEYGNPYEVHQSHLEPDIFLERGYKCETLGARDVAGSNITAIKNI